MCSQVVVRIEGHDGNLGLGHGEGSENERLVFANARPLADGPPQRSSNPIDRPRMPRSLRRHRDVVWVPKVLRLVFAVMRLVPRSIWRRMPR